MSQTFYARTAAYYDAITADFAADTECYQYFAAERSATSVLDVGCGTGRVLLPLAEAGYRVVGVDDVPAMLAIARAKLAAYPQATLYEDDILVHTGGPYDLILLSFNALLHFTRQDDQIALLEHLGNLLSPAGRLAIDIPNAAEAYATEDTGALIFERDFEHNGTRIMQFSISTLERTAQLLHTQWVYDTLAPDGSFRRDVIPLTMRYVFPAELTLMLRAAGLQTIARFGDYDLMPFEEGSERLLALVERAT
ncbi:MAG: class I SAM-dependent methyltransferase [Anaerolineales bacterium]